MIGIIIGVLSIFYLTYNLPEMNCSKKINHIEWGFNSGFYRWIYAFTLGIAIYTNISLKYKAIIITWFTFSWLYFFHKQYNIKNLNYMIDGTELSNQLPSLWCNIASLSSPLIYLLGYLKL